jgi:hypothetical protein
MNAIFPNVLFIDEFLHKGTCSTSVLEKLKKNNSSIYYVNKLRKIDNKANP